MVTIRRSETTQSREGIRPAARPWEASGQVDVELLCQWAYGAQLVDRFERVGLHAIEAAAAGYEVSSYSADGVGQLMQIHHLGCRVDRGGVLIGDVVHPAAYAVANVLREIEGGELVRGHAISGTRPRSWVVPAEKVRAAIWVKEGREAMVEYQGPGRKGGYCNVIITWDAAREAWGRRNYSRWYAALAELAWRLSARSLGFVVSGPMAPAEPWAAPAKSNAGPPISIDESARPRGGPTPPRGSSRGGQE
jgi:hypothetical protein